MIENNLEIMIQEAYSLLEEMKDLRSAIVSGTIQQRINPLLEEMIHELAGAREFIDKMKM